MLWLNSPDQLRNIFTVVPRKTANEPDNAPRIFSRGRVEPEG